MARAGLGREGARDPGGTMANRSSATTEWQGDLKSGSGRVGLGSGLGGEMAVDWRARTEGAADRTTPEELIAAAHSACFSMALSNILAGGGNAPETLRTQAVVHFESSDTGFRISKIELAVSGSVPNIRQPI